MSNFLKIGKIPNVIPNATGIQNQIQKTIGKNASSQANWTSTFRNATDNWNDFTNRVDRRILWLSALLVVIIAYFIYAMYQYYQRKNAIRDERYVYESFPYPNEPERLKKLYYGSPLKMEKVAIPGSLPGSFWYRDQSSIRVLSIPQISTSLPGITIRMWMRLAPENYTENIGVERPRAIFTRGLTGTNETESDLIANPNLLLANTTWIENTTLGLFLNRQVNQLQFQVGKAERTTGQPSTMTCLLDDVPVQKWFHLAYIVRSHSVEAYIDGELMNVWSAPNGVQFPEGSTLAYFQQVPTTGFWGWTSFFQVLTSPMNIPQLQKQYRLEKVDIDIWNRIHRGRPDKKPSIQTNCLSGEPLCQTSK